MPATQPMCPRGCKPRLVAIDHAHRRASSNHSIQGQDGNRRGTTDLRTTFPDCRVSARLDQGALRTATVSLSRPPQGQYGSDLGCLSYNLARWFSIRRKFNMELAYA